MYRAEVSTLSYEECNEDWDYSIDEDYQFCALGMDNADACDGDSGSPLVEADSEVQIGVVSFGSNCNDPNGKGGAYTRVDAHVDWIRSYIENEKDQSVNHHGHTSSKPYTSAEQITTTTRRPSGGFPYLG